MSMLAALMRRYERMAARGKAPVTGYSAEKIGFNVVLDKTGAVVDVAPLGTIVRGKSAPRVMSVPQPVKRASGVAANLLWDKTSYVFGAADPGKPSKRAERSGQKPGAAEFDAFARRQREAIGETSDDGLRALLAFLENWDSERYASLPHARDMLDANVVFSLDGDKGWLHDRPAAHALVARAGGDGATGFCLVRGEEAPVARLHPSIKGVRGAQSSGASIVSFNQTSFTSYGKEQGDNAPVSEYAAFAYSSALNMLLADRRHRVQIGDASVVFWAEADEGEDAAPVEEVFGSFFGGASFEAEEETPDAPSANAQERDLLAALDQIAHGQAPGRSIDPATKFYVLGLSPNAARISVRFWLDTTIEQLAEKLARHFEDLRLEPPAWKNSGAPTIKRLIYCLAAIRRNSDGTIKIMTSDENLRFEHANAHIAGELARAILTGARYPLSILSTLLMRLRVDREITPLRVALIKGSLCRSYEGMPVSIDIQERNIAYRLGRLFGILERMQAAALGRRNATIRDKFYATASATPARVFPALIRNAKNHSKSIRSKVGPGLAEWFEDRIAEVLNGPTFEFPRTLSLDWQGRFAIGYYHQREAFNKKTAAAPIDLDIAENVDADEE
ncbi:type I-C CRISPR-associated protein Cas8c/Csd1 [Methylocella sp.]|uniref:type I-C CRISPR-associated protein Cas8c/Csd1 n=1 Tax=Methylocella sp. TaxID=1978226 RepID=UPI0037840EC3